MRNGTPRRRRRSRRNLLGVLRSNECQAAIPATSIITGMIQMNSEETTKDARIVVSSLCVLLVMS